MNKFVVDANALIILFFLPVQKKNKIANFDSI